jgi:hypothetical protein
VGLMTRAAKPEVPQARLEKATATGEVRAAMTTTAGARAAKESDCVPPALRWLPIHARATAAARITATLPQRTATGLST